MHGKVYGGCLFLVQGKKCEWSRVTVSGSAGENTKSKIFGRLIEVRQGTLVIGKGCFLQDNVNETLAANGGGAVEIGSGGVCIMKAVVEEVAKDYEDVTYEHMLVDNCAMQLVNNPRQFDVILTENMFGDILSDEASMITGSIGMLSSASLAEGKFGLYEPSHGSAPDIAGQDIANPIATILSAAMMLRYSFDLDKEADEIEKAVKAVLADGYRTVDIMSDGMKKVGCKEMGQLIIDQIK